MRSRVTEELQARYAPILRFARGEHFYPMAVEDFCRYSTLRSREASTPLLDQGRVTLSLLARAFQDDHDLYLQSVPAPLADQNVAARWSKDVLRTLMRVSYHPSTWQAEVARLAYSWFSDKTQDATKLFWWNDLVMALVGMGKQSRQDLPRLDLPPEIRQAAIENYEGGQQALPPYTYYHRTTHDDRYLCLQYWFFYAFNDWATGFGGMNDHEGDWEGLYLFFDLDAAGRPQEPPAYVTFPGHHSRLTKPWRHPDVTLEGSHPVGHVAAGSHATYPECKEYELIRMYGLLDRATGDGLTIGPGDWHQAIDLDAQPWTAAFLGAWGTRYWLPLSWAKKTLGLLKTRADQYGLPGVSGPRGPRYADDGSVRPNWLSAAAWAGIQELEKLAAGAHL
jgi:hypothetical protein